MLSRFRLIAATTVVAFSLITPSVHAENGSSIIINEFMPDPSSGNDWIELYNPGVNDGDLSGYKLDDIDGGSTPRTIASGSIVPAHGFLAIDVSTILNQSNDSVRLLRPDGTVVDSFPYSSTVKDRTYGRLPDGGAWYSDLAPSRGASNGSAPTPTATATPTSTATATATETSIPTETPLPNETPTATSSPTASATKTPTASRTPSPTKTATMTPTATASATPFPEGIRISEFMPAPSNGNPEWVELENTFDVEADLSNWLIGDASSGRHKIAPETLIPAHGFKAVMISTSMLNNTGDSVKLIRPDGSEVETITYQGDQVRIDASFSRTEDGDWTTYAPPSPEEPNLQPEPTATATPTETATATDTATSTRTSSPTRTPSPTRTASATRTPSMTRTPSETHEPTETREPTDTHEPSATREPSETRTPSSTKTPSSTRTPSFTRTPSPTKTPSNTRTPSSTRTTVVEDAAERSETPDNQSQVDLEADIILNEVLPAPKTRFQTEWVELANQDTVERDLKGWMIDDDEGGGAPQTLSGKTIAGKGFLLVEIRGSLLNNGGDSVRLLRPDGSVASSFTFDAVQPDQSFSRLAPDSDEWTADNPPSPGVANSQADMSDTPEQAIEQTTVEAVGSEQALTATTLHQEDTVQLTATPFTANRQIFTPKGSRYTGPPTHSPTVQAIHPVRPRRTSAPSLTSPQAASDFSLLWSAILGVVGFVVAGFLYVNDRRAHASVSVPVLPPEENTEDE